jgi:transcriptional regulator with XRE-family HTH domain
MLSFEINGEAIGEKSLSLQYLSKEKKSELKNYILHGKISSQIIWKENDKAIHFNDDVWLIHGEKISFKTKSREIIPDKFLHQIKVFTLHAIFLSSYRYRPNTLASYISTLKTFSVSAKKLGIYSFKGLNIEDINLVLSISKTLSRNNTISVFRAILRSQNRLYYNFDEEVNFKSISSIIANDPDPKQYPVIPYRIYKNQLKYAEDFLIHANEKIDVISDTLRDYLSDIQKIKMDFVYRVRNGLINSTDRYGFAKTEKTENFFNALEIEGIPISDGKGINMVSEEVFDDFGIRVREERLRQGFTQKELSKSTTITAKHLMRIEFGYQKARPETARSICLALGIEPVGFGIKIHSGEQYQEDDKWMRLFERYQPSLIIENVDSYSSRGYYKVSRIRPFHFSGEEITTAAELLELINKINALSCFVCLAYTGMRAHEFGRIQPDFAAQFVSVFSGNVERRIPVITTLTTKITEAGQAKNRIFVTTNIAHTAIRLLNYLHGCYRKHLPIDEQNNMFIYMENFTWIKKVDNVASYVSLVLSFRFKKHINLDECTLNSEDIKLLSISESGRIDEYKEGTVWKFSAHQLRRSLVYYLAGLELASFMELKEQLGHLSLAMTMYYGRNAEEFTEVYRVFEAQRLSTQADKMSEIYSRIKNGERVAGGKGKAMRAEIESDGFEKQLLDRKCSKEYWLQELSSTRDAIRIHAVAPGIICTNHACDMRIDIDLSECIDCEFDFIESAAYAEFARQASMEKIAWMEDNKQVFPDMIAKELVTIRSCEKIMEDLDMSFDSYDISDRLILLTEIV